MFAYCGNNPVIFADPSGCLYFFTLDMETYGFLSSTLQHYTGGGGSIATSKSASSQVIRKEIDFFNNTSEQIVLESTTIAFYHGVPVLKADLGNGSAFSFGMIVMDDDYVFDQLGVNTLKHEYGHRLHMNDIGVVSYTMTTAIPSLICAGLTNVKILPNKYYYSLPWEHIAEHYGGAQRSWYTSWSDDLATIYWIFTMVFGG